jgi:hypothetical protein
MPYAAKSPSLRSPFEFFVDRALGGHTVVESLRRSCLSGEVVHAHDEHFGQATTDIEWLTEVGKRGWVVLTKDVRIRTNANEREAVLASRVALFALGRGDLSGARMSEVFCSALPRIRIVLGQYSVPLIATITADVIVTVRTANGENLDPPKVYRPKHPKNRPGG